MKTSKITLALLIVQIFCLFIPSMVSGQTETIDIVQYTPPTGWTKTPKEGAVVYTDVNKTTNAFCILTIYGGRASTGNPSQDFANKWNEFVVTPFKAEANPKTETQTTPDGWQATVAASPIEMEGVKAYAILTVLSGFGKTVSILAILNEQSYLAQVQTFIDGIKLDKAKTSPNPVPAAQNYDPFPDQPGFAPQKPLTGTLKMTITMDDLVGRWDRGSGSVQTYIDSSTGDYSRTETSFSGEQLLIKADGTFEYKFVGRSNNSTARESDSGTIILSDGYITFKFKTRLTEKYRLIAFMTEPNGAAILSLIGVNDNFQGYDAAGRRLECGHSRGFISCVGGEEWARLQP